MQGCLYYTANEVQKLLGVSRSMAYRIVKNLNKQLEEKGYIVVPGRIPKSILLKSITAWM